MSSFCQVRKEDIWLTITDADGDMIRLSADAAPQLIGDLLMALGAPVPLELTSLTIEAPDADVDALRELGHEWIKKSTQHWPGAHRIYFETLHGWYGLATSGERTFRGERCSLLEAESIFYRFRTARVYFDVSVRKFCGQRINQEDFEFIVEQIRTLERAPTDD